MGYKRRFVFFYLKFAVLIYIFKFLIIILNIIFVYQNVNIVYKFYIVYFTPRVRTNLNKFIIKKKLAKSMIF